MSEDELHRKLASASRLTLANMTRQVREGAAEYGCQFYE
jgi:hypothetical protein